MNQLEPIVVPLTSIDQLVEACPPSPFRKRRLREEAENFLVECVTSLPRRAIAKLLIIIPKSDASQADTVEEAVHEHFNYRRVEAEKQLKRIRHFGWTSLVIALVFLTVAMLLVQTMKRYLPETNFVSIITVGLTVFAWVALWRPCELLLYEWYPIKRDAGLFRKLEASEIEFSYRDQVVSPQTRDESRD
jgi:hypothetical protein